MSIKEWVVAHRDDMIRTAQELMRIRSVSEPGTREHPYGEGCACVLDKALELGQKMGFRAENHGYYCGSLFLQGKTEREIGIFVHLDVVHEGAGWSVTDPYMPMEKDGWLYGRGSADDKGPAAAALYSMGYFISHGVKLNHTIRLYLGCSEERGMEDIEYYTAHFPAPDFSIIPDASFPVCFAEKGILEGEFSCSTGIGHVVNLTAGTSSNAVPGEAMAELDGVLFKTVKDYVTTLDHCEDFSVEKDNQRVVIRSVGKSAHAAFPEGSDSAAVKLGQALSQADFLSEEERKRFGFVSQGFADYYGEDMGIAYEDTLSDRLTLVGGTIRTAKGRFIQNFNIRYPVTTDTKAMIEQLKHMGEAYGWRLDWSHDNPPCVISPDSEAVKGLTDICRRVLNVDLQPYSMGGGTYARKLPNAVAFGPGIRRQKKPCSPGHGGGHQPDECVKIENLTNAMEIYIEALQYLDTIIK